MSFWGKILRIIPKGLREKILAGMRTRFRLSYDGPNVQYCAKCIIPSTRPNIALDTNGVCNACNAATIKKEIDWEGRKKMFRDVVELAKRRSDNVSVSGYDCLIPVSGGKDSTWQVAVCLEHGLTPLAVTWKTPARTELGQRNLDNLIRLGVDHIDFQVNPKVEKRFMYQALVRFGSTAIPMHMALFNIPLTIAVRYHIPLVIWGENSAFEYGGTEDEQKGFQLNSEWLKKFGVTHGTTAKDWIQDGFTKKELLPYFGPSDAQLEAAGVRAVFLGYYFPWDTETSLKAASERGFQVRTEGAKTGYYNYADIDDDFISIHHYLKWYKFGFTRLFDNLSVEIRNGRLTREEAIDIVRKSGDQTPHEDIEKLCKYLDISKEHFFEIAEGFRNRNIWKKRHGTWQIDDFIIPDWKWK